MSESRSAWGASREAPFAPTDGTESAEEIGREFGVDLNRGLDQDEAERRLRADGPNELPAEQGTPWWRLLVRQFIEPMAILLVLAAAIAAFALRQPLDAIAILVIVVLRNSRF